MTVAKRRPRKTYVKLEKTVVVPIATSDNDYVGCSARMRQCGKQFWAFIKSKKQFSIIWFFKVCADVGCTRGHIDAILSNVWNILKMVVYCTRGKVFCTCLLLLQLRQYKIIKRKNIYVFILCMYIYCCLKVLIDFIIKKKILTTKIQIYIFSPVI